MSRQPYTMNGKRRISATIIHQSDAFPIKSAHVKCLRAHILRRRSGQRDARGCCLGTETEANANKCLCRAKPHPVACSISIVSFNGGAPCILCLFLVLCLGVRLAVPHIREKQIKNQNNDDIGNSHIASMTSAECTPSHGQQPNTT